VSMAQEMPQFPGGESAMIQYLIENIKTPAGAENMSGRVEVRFVVGTDGAVRDVSILKSVNPLLDAEAVRVVKTMPAFTPGKTDGKPVAVHYVLPIQFKAVGKDEPSKNTAQSIMQVTMTDNGKDVHPIIYINGVRQDDGQTSLMSIDTADIESMSIDKSGDRPTVYVTVKKKK
ncbi:MAG: energy transducer TonB, partial [Muribaculaceae bacterium]|nr:energy transducer TonB [Muribaculaceae bacterium]